MAKCIRCGSSFLTRRRIKLKDAEICGNCFKELGFDKSDLLTAAVYPYDSIKDGKQAYYLNKRKKASKDEITGSVSVSMAHNGEQRDLVCTEEERMVFDELVQICSGQDLPEQLRLVRVSDNYVTARIGDYDLARFKYTNRAKWISFPLVPPGSEKHRFEDVQDIQDMTALVLKSLEAVRVQLRYSN